MTTTAGDKPTFGTSTPLPYLPSIALFGSTGGCLLSTLTRLLSTPAPADQPPQHIAVLVRSASKLTSLLTSHGIPSSTISARLQIHEGDVLTTPSAVHDTISLPPGYPSGNRWVDVILFGVGAYPKATFMPPFYTMDNPKICQDAMNIILNTLRDPPATGVAAHINKPVILAISSTGLHRGGEEDPRDISLPMLWFYKLTLGEAHKDKVAMEDALVAAARSSKSISDDKGQESENEKLCDFIVLRGALYTNEPGGVKPLRAGYAKRVGGKGEGEGAKYGDLSGPAIGCFIGREDMGRWIFEELASGKVGWKEGGVGGYGAEWKGKRGRENVVREGVIEHAAWEHESIMGRVRTIRPLKVQDAGYGQQLRVVWETDLDYKLNTALLFVPQASEWKLPGLAGQLVAAISTIVSE
ncbi:hypothetical protein BDZ91DRAFT_761129 [Kalaharituber pfeilii]|nr:hypothetical protein BDZ91DRAFT_761129 [Kalaharituber pfeilii]